MRICPRLVVVLSDVAANYRKPWIIAACILASLSVGISEPALAQNECGPLDPNGSVTCTNAGNNYNSGIAYLQNIPGDFTVNLDSDVNVTLTTPNSQSPAPHGNAVYVDNRGGSAIVEDPGATINATVFPDANVGVHAESSNGSAIVTVDTVSGGRIDVAGAGGENAIAAFVIGTPAGGEAKVTYTGPTTDPGLTSSGANSTIIQVGNFTGGNATIDASGSMSGFTGVTGVSNGVSGLFATAVGDGNATVIYRSGTIDMSGTFANGIFAAAGEGGGWPRSPPIPARSSKSPARAGSL